MAAWAVAAAVVAGAAAGPRERRVAARAERAARVERAAMVPRRGAVVMPAAAAVGPAAACT